MLHVSFNPYRLEIRESVGLAHELQVVEIPVPESAAALFSLRDEKTGRLFPVQSARQKPGFGFVLLALEPDTTLSLVLADGATPELSSSVTVEENDEVWTVSNGNYSIELSAGHQIFGKGRSGLALGPVRRVKQAQGPWRGSTFFDTAKSPLRETASWLEKGPLRSVYHYRIEFEGDGFYDVEVTLDATLDFIRFNETFRGSASDQIIWNFVGADLPERIDLLDSTAGYTPRWLHYHVDQRHARLWCWNQFSQLHDLSDGFGLRFTGSDDALGLVSFEGGKWSGNALNHLEAWTRRWQDSDPTTRRLPWDTKADSFPGPDSIPARGTSVNQPHFTLEGWLKNGARRFALVLSTRDRLAPKVETAGAKGETGCSVELGHFEHVPRRDLYFQLQARLRKINIQFGLISLQDQLGMAFDWPLEQNFAAQAGSLNPGQENALDVSRAHQKPAEPEDPDNIKRIDDYMAARVYGFWEGSGSAYTNCVVSRTVGPYMFQFENLALQGKLSAAQIARWRAWFTFLAHLYHTDNFYVGASSMGAIDSANSVEPTMAGMSNQNFYTDIITLFAYAAQVFPHHPSTNAWREKFLLNWQRQLAYHVFPKSGLWEESHTYYQHVLATVLPLFLRRQADGTGDDLTDPAFHKVVAGAIPQMTPRNAIVGGVRHLTPFGDHGADPMNYRYIYRVMARAFAESAPGLAGHLAWVYAEMKGDALADVPAVAPQLATGYFAGLGYFFRNNVGAENESLLALRSGMAWGHHHSDDGSIQFYAHGRALIVDSASSQPQERGERKALAPGQSRATVDGIEPLNHLWRFNRGWILAQAARPKLSFAVAGTPTFASIPKGMAPTPLARAIWELRAVVELAPAVYLVADHLDTAHRHIVRFHVAHQEVTLEGNRLAANFGGDCRLEIAPLSPVAPPALSLDRPLNPAKLPQEITTSVEYGGVTGPWALFIVAAFGADDRLNATADGNTTKVEVGGKTITIRHEAEKLEVTDGSEHVVVDTPTLLGNLRAGSR